MEDAESLRNQIAILQEELDSLRARYDTLSEANTRTAKRYKADYKKWRDFRDWLFPDPDTEKQVMSFLKSSEFHACARAYALRNQRHLEDSELKMEQDEDTKDVKREHEGDTKVGLVLSSPVAVPSGHQRRDSYHGEPPQKVLLSSPTLNQDPFLVPLSTHCDDESPVLHSNNDISPKAGPSRPLPSTEPRRRKGRYAHVPSGMDTINSRFSIRKDKNQGVDHQYDAVVRNQEERKHMLGSDCECCREYYEAVGPLPASRQPLWRTPTKRKSPYSLRVCNKENTDEVEEHKQMISRHRHHWHRPKTPPGYWDIGFPDTQEVLDINRRAAEMHKRKLFEVEAEAKSDNSRYVAHAPRTP